MSVKWRILIVDDSAISRGILEKSFSQSPYFEVVTSVSNGRKAVDFCHANKVDLVVTDCDMPEMDGIEETGILTGELGIPVCVYSDDNAKKSDAIEAGAILFEIKPSLTAYNPKAFSAFIESIRLSLTKKGIFPAAQENPESDSTKEQNSSAEKGYTVLCIGASTGGPNATKDVLNGLGKGFPLPILYVQHIDVGADEKMVSWFNSVCPNIPMHLAKDGETALAGHAYMAPAEKHLVIDFVRSDGRPVLKLSDEPQERFLRPAVNKLFRSAAHQYKRKCLAVLLTGMGRDGAEGCKEIVENGGYTIAEDRSTCAVFGMPAAAIELGAARAVIPRNQIPEKILSLVRED